MKRLPDGVAHPATPLAPRARAYAQLVKPGIVLGNLVSTAGGYLLASEGNWDLARGALVLAGVGLVVASGCAVNNVIDHDIDAVMVRTHQRPTANGAIGRTAALACAGILLVLGMALLYAATWQWLAPALVLAGYAGYVVLYTLLLKRRSVHGTLAGSLAGAMPPVVGYCAVSGTIDAVAWTILLVFSLWQMPHSYAIAILRDSDYRAAGIPMLPIVRGTAKAQQQIVAYMVMFISACVLLAVLDGLGWMYLASVLLSGTCWLWLALQGFTAPDLVPWARKVFFASIVVVVVLSLAMSTDFLFHH